ncbi:hypothetical protein HOH87_01625, partial [bacterium]|nr:hypothetical protein [bacterium]
NHAIQDTVSKQPNYQTNVANGHAGLVFSEVNADELTMGTIASQFPTAGSVIIVADIDEDDQYDLFHNYRSNYTRDTDGNGDLGAFKSTTLSNTPVNVPSSGKHIFVTRSGSSAYTYNIDGSIRYDGPGDYNPGGSSDEYEISRSGLFNGKILEVVLFDKYLSDSEYQAIMGDLQSKWDIEIDTDGDGVLDTLDAFPNDSTRMTSAPAPSSFESVSANIRVWLDASATGNGGVAMMEQDESGNVSKWLDISGNGNHAIQDTVSKQPNYQTNVANGLAGLVFSEVNADEMTMGAIYSQFPTAGSVIVVAEIDEDDQYTLFSNYLSNDYVRNTNGSGAVGPFKTTRLTNTLINVPSSGKHIFVTKSDSSAYTYNIDGSVRYDGPGNYNSGTSSHPYELSRNGVLDGKLLEVVVFDKYLSDTEQQAIMADLQSKWDIDVDTDGDSILDDFDAFPNDPTKIIARPTPSSIDAVSSNIRVWLDASATGNSGVAMMEQDESGNVSKWLDISGNGNHAIQDTVSKQPNYQPNVVNDLPGIVFTEGNIDELSMGVITTQFPTEGSVIVVAEIDNDDTYDLLSNYPNSPLTRASDGNGDAGVFRTSILTDTPTNVPSADTHIFVTRSSSSAYTINLDGAIEYNGGGNYNPGNTSSKYLLSRSGASLEGKILEVLIFDKYLSDTELANINSDLTSKWVSPTGHFDNGTAEISADLDLTSEGDGNFVIGEEGTSTVTIGDNTTVTSTETIIGNTSTATGTFTVDQPNTFIHSATMRVGKEGEGTVNHSAGTVSADALVIGEEAGSDGTFNLSGTAVLRVKDISTGSGTSAFNMTGGTLISETINTSITNGGGILSPGGATDTGTTAITGNFTQSSGKTVFGIRSPSDLDRVTVTGALDLSGDVEIQLLDGFDPEPGHVFDLFDSNSFTGDPTFILPAIPNSLEWDTTHLKTDGKIRMQFKGREGLGTQN